MTLDHPVARCYGGKTSDGRSLVVYSWSRTMAHRRLREAGVVGRIRRLIGKIVNGKPELPPARVKIDLLGKRIGP